jgi:hypothetical protein
MLLRAVEIAISGYIDWSARNHSMARFGPVPTAGLEAHHWATSQAGHYPKNHVLAGVGA